MLVKFDYSTLKRFIRENFGTNREFSKFIGISEAALHARLASKVPFTQSEMDKVADHFTLNAEMAARLFFTREAGRIAPPEP